MTSFAEGLTALSDSLETEIPPLSLWLGMQSVWWLGVEFLFDDDAIAMSAGGRTARRIAGALLEYRSQSNIQQYEKAESTYVRRRMPIDADSRHNQARSFVRGAP